MDPQIAYQPPTGPDQVVEGDWLYERPDGTTVPAPAEAVGTECGRVTALWDLFLVPRGRPQVAKGDDDDDLTWLDEPPRSAHGAHDCESDNYEY